MHICCFPFALRAVESLSGSCFPRVRWCREAVKIHVLHLVKLVYLVSEHRRWLCLHSPCRNFRKFNSGQALLSTEFNGNSPAFEYSYIVSLKERNFKECQNSWIPKHDFFLILKGVAGYVELQHGTATNSECKDWQKHLTTVQSVACPGVG